jgi:hypothetical protein
VAAVVGWMSTLVAALTLVLSAPDTHRVVILGAASSVGMTVLGGAGLLAVTVRRGASLSGFGRVLLVTVGGAVVAGSLGWATSRAFADTDSGAGVVAALGAAALAGIVVVVAFITVVAAVDRRYVREPLVGVLRRMR